MDTHVCPVIDCTRVIPGHMVACRSHWFSLPSPLRSRIWREYRDAPGSPEHLEAITEALRLLNHAALEQCP